MMRYYLSMVFLLAFSASVQVIDASADAPAVPYITGGVGDEMEDLRAVERDYDLKLLLTARDGAYLADVHVTVSDARGNVVLDTVTDGPVLLVRLPAGTYNVRAEYLDMVQQSKVTVSPNALHSYQMRFNIAVARS